MLRAALIGFGVIGRVHIDAIESLQNAALVAVCDTDLSKKSAVPAGAVFYGDYEEMLERERPDVAHICLPHFLHYPVAKRAAEAGCNIFAEKPLAMNGDEARAYLDLEEQYGVKICLCLQNRLNPTTETLYRLLRSGEYGALTGIRGSVNWYRSREYYEAGPWRGIMAQAGGGCMINQAIHTIDLMQYFAGSPVVTVRGTTARILDYGLEVEDTAAGRFVFENGALGLFTASVANYTDENVELSLRCEGGQFLIRDKKLFRLRDTGHELLAADDAEFAGKAVYGNSHIKLIDLFYRAVESGGGWYIHPEEGLPSIRIIDAIRESARTGKTVHTGR
ncbi:MAG: Gfo/Idh/MocA family oxidoreductase [Treponema sp.]|jgi:predicted dehydrogenase|nr:Gfo/Idh/MocA family oxidoreductase [Treponema sp.]